MKPGWWRSLFFARIFSPQGLVVRAAAIVVAYLVLHACGLREYTTLMTGTSPAGGAIDRSSALLAFFYVAAHVGAVVLAPIMILAAVGWAAWLYWRDRAETPGIG